MALGVIRKLIPAFFKDYIRRKKVASKFKGSGRRICSDEVSLSAKIGKGVYIAKNVNVRAHVTIGDYSYCSSGTILFNNTQIGKYCSIGYNVQIGCPEHPAHFLSASPSIYRDAEIKKYCPWPEDDYKEKVIIDNDVWIGSNVTVLQGVHIGNGAIIAAGAVVTKDVPPYTIWGGVPAKQLKVREFETNGVELTDWWNHDIAWIREYFDNIYKGKEEQK